MIEGAVNADHQAVIGLRVVGPSGRTREIEAVVDTGFNGFLTLPPAIVADLRLVRTGLIDVLLADGSEASLDVHDVTVSWDGQPRGGSVYESSGMTLAGMALLDGYQLCVDVAPGGRVAIEAMA